MSQQTWIARLKEEVSIAPLVTFRVIFGALMFGSTLRFWYLGWINTHFVQPEVHFKYFGFYWVEPLPEWGMYLVHALMLLASAGIALGYRYRLSATTFFILFTYTELIDLTYYLNHYYFVSIVAFALIFVPANGRLSLDVVRNPRLALAKVPRASIIFFQLMVALVYIFAGIAKINYHWLIEAMPLRIWLPANNYMPVLGPLFDKEITAYVFSWAGMLYDCTIPFFLLWPKTRKLAYVAVLFFHTTVGWLFQIGVFPVVMTLVVSVFFSPEWHEKIVTWFEKRFSPATNQDQKAWTPSPWLAKVAIVFVAIQLIFPFRYLAYGGNFYWHEQGYRFGWRVMLVEKAGTARFFVRYPGEEHRGEVVNSDFLNMHQEKQMAFQPDMILQFAHILADYYTRDGQRPEVTCECYVTMNASKSKLIVDPKVDLASIEDSWAKKNWITRWEE